MGLHVPGDAAVGRAQGTEVQSPLPSGGSGGTPRQLPPAAARETFPGRRGALETCRAPAAFPGAAAAACPGTRWREAAAAAAAALARSSGLGAGARAASRGSAVDRSVLRPPGSLEPQRCRRQLQLSARPPAGPTSQPPLRPSLSPALPPLPKRPPLQSPVAAATTALAAAVKARLLWRAASSLLPASVSAFSRASRPCSGGGPGATSASLPCLCRLPASLLCSWALAPSHPRRYVGKVGRVAR